MPSIVVQPSPATRVAPVVKPVVPAKAGTPMVAPQTPPRPAASALANTVAKAIESRTPAPAATSVYDQKGRIAPAPSPKANAPLAAAPAPAAEPDGALFATSDRFSVEIQASDSGYANRIVWSSDGFKTTHDIGIDNENVGTVQTMTVARGARVEFGIISGDGRLYRAGPSSLNADGEVHATVTGDADSFTLGFEDLYGGGDRDFNDAIIRVKGFAASPPAPAGAGGAASSGNRSGLGDGTNPGQGAGTARSPNEGTLNPNQAATAAAERNGRLLDSLYGANGAGNPAKDTSRGGDRPAETRKPEVAPTTSQPANKPADKPAAVANSQKEQAATDARKLKEQADAKRLKDEADAKKLKEAADAQKAREAAEAKLKAAAAAAATSKGNQAAEATKAPEPTNAGKAKETAGAGKVNEAAAASKAVELARKSK